MRPNSHLFKDEVHPRLLSDGQIDSFKTEGQQEHELDRALAATPRVVDTVGEAHTAGEALAVVKVA